MPAHSTYERLRIRVDEMETERKPMDNTRQEIADNLLGRRDFVTQRTKGQQRMQRIYDDTAKVSGDLLAGALHSLMSSPAAPWFELRFEDPALQEDADNAAWLKLAEKRMYAAIAAPRANFHAQLSEVYTDLIYFGLGALFIDDVPGIGIQFSARPLQEMFVSEDPSGRIDTVARKFKLTARQAVELWGDAAVTATKSLAGQSTEDRHTYVHIIVERDDVVFGNLDSSGMPWASYHLSLEDNAILSEGGFHELPFAIPRWSSDSGEVDGRGPGWNALSNQKMLNEMKKVKITAGQLNVNPVKLVDSNAVLPGDLRWHPGATIPIDSVMSTMNPAVQPILLGGDSRMTTEDIIDARKSVQDAFHHQLVETIRDPRMTATQVLELASQMQRHMAPILGRMHTELLEPIIERVFAIEARAGRLPPAPPELEATQIKIDYVSPIARAQQTSNARAIIDYMGIATNVGAVVPEVLDVVDFDEQMRQLADSLGVPLTGIRDREAVAVRREAAAQLAEQEQAQQQAVMATDQIAKLAKAIPQQQGAA